MISFNSLGVVKYSYLSLGQDGCYSCCTPPRCFTEPDSTKRELSPFFRGADHSEYAPLANILLSYFVASSLTCSNMKLSLSWLTLASLPAISAAAHSRLPCCRQRPPRCLRVVHGLRPRVPLGMGLSELPPPPPRLITS